MVIHLEPLSPHGEAQQSAPDGLFFLKHTEWLASKGKWKKFPKGVDGLLRKI